MQHRQQIEQDIRTAEGVAQQLRTIDERGKANGREDGEQLEAARAIERLAIIASRDETDQGFSNHETFGVAMFLAGNLTGADDYRRAAELTREAVAKAPGDASSQGARTAVTNALAAWVTLKAHERVHGSSDEKALTLELLTAALSRVDWRELAEVQLSTVPEAAE